MSMGPFLGLPSLIFFYRYTQNPQEKLKLQHFPSNRVAFLPLNRVNLHFVFNCPTFFWFLVEFMLAFGFSGAELP